MGGSVAEGAMQRPLTRRRLAVRTRHLVAEWLRSRLLPALWAFDDCDDTIQNSVDMMPVDNGLAIDVLGGFNRRYLPTLIARNWLWHVTAPFACLAQGGEMEPFWAKMT